MEERNNSGDSEKGFLKDEEEEEDDLLLRLRQPKQQQQVVHPFDNLSSYSSEDEDEDEDGLTLSQHFGSHRRSKPLGVWYTIVLEEEEEEEGGGNIANVPIRKWKKTSKSKSKRVVPHKAINSRRCKRKRAARNEFDDHVKVQASVVMERAEEVRLNLDPKFPSFIKLMLRSHVTHGFWLGLPMRFCRLHMPKCNTTIVLEGEDEEEYKTNFLFEKVGLSGGWRGFSLAHKLLEGDVVVFELVQPHKFKVYIARANCLGEVDGALSLLNLDNCSNETDDGFEEKDIKRCRKANENQQMSLSLEMLQETIVEKDIMSVNSNLAPVTESENNREVVVTSEDVDDCGLSNSQNSFVDFRDFKILVNDCIIDSQLPMYLQAKYYELFRTRKSYLHQHLLKGINHTLAAGIISETINIAEAIRASKLSTSLDHFATWGKTLEAFELLGMDVEFLLARMRLLVGLAAESREQVDSKRYAEARCERDHIEEEVRILELKLIELKQASSRLEKEMVTMKENAKRYELMFEEEANAAW